MASVIEYGNGLKRIDFNVQTNGQRRCVRLGHCDRRTAETFCLRIEKLVASKITNTAVDTETASWLAGLNDKVYNRLAAAGLVAGRQPTQQRTLRELLAEYKRFTAAAVKPSTMLAYGHVLRNLQDCFGDKKPLADITAFDADTFRTWLSAHERLAQATRNRRIITARAIFRKAVDWCMVKQNAFANTKGGGQANESRKQFIPAGDIQKVLSACPDIQWRALVVLSRFGGLRVPSEALLLTWQDVNWDAGTMLVHSPKTEHHEGQETRIIPLFAELRNVLLEAFEAAEPGETFVISRYRSGASNLRTQFERIILRAGLKPWPKPWHNMRASRQTELMAAYSLSTACRWLGNSPAVAARHYAMTVDGDADLQQAISQPPAISLEAGAAKSAVKAQQFMQEYACNAKNVSGDKCDKQANLQGYSDICTDKHINKLGVCGRELRNGHEGWNN